MNRIVFSWTYHKHKNINTVPTIHPLTLTLLLNLTFIETFFSENDTWVVQNNSNWAWLIVFYCYTKITVTMHFLSTEVDQLFNLSFYLCSHSNNKWLSWAEHTVIPLCLAGRRCSCGEISYLPTVHHTQWIGWFCWWALGADCCIP